MRLINRTAYRDDHLRAIIERVAREETADGGTSGYRVTVSYALRANSSSGYAYLGKRTMIVRLPRPGLAVDLVDFALTIAHEFAHTRGMRHRQMRGSPRYYRLPAQGEGANVVARAEHRTAVEALYGWARSMPLDVAAPPAPPRDVTATAARATLARKLGAAQATLRDKRRRLALAKTIVRRWELRVARAQRFLDRADVAARTPPHAAE